MEAEELPIEEDAILEFTTREEYITCACNALSTVECINAMTAADEARVKRIVKKCLRILDSMVGEMYEELFEAEDED